MDHAVLQVELAGSAEEVERGASLAVVRDAELGATIGIAPADGPKCERCWHYSPSCGNSLKYHQVCTRCVESLELMDFPAVAAPAEASAELDTETAAV